MKYFDKYYVGFAENRQTASGKPLGFAVPDGTDSAAKKRKKTVDEWASGRYYYSNEETPAAGKVYDNVPMTGFRLTEWNGRYVTDNKVVRVLDPRGFELEIYIPNLMDIILNCEVDHGLIKEELVWLREGANNRLVRTADPTFAEAKRLTEAAGQKLNTPRLGHEVGDIISNTYGTFLYMGLMDVEFVVPRGERVVDEKMTRDFGTRRVGGCDFFGMGRIPVREVVHRTYYRISDDRLESVSTGRRHVYKNTGSDAITFRKSKMATLKIESSGNSIPAVGEKEYFRVDYDTFMFYDTEGQLYTQKEHFDIEKNINQTIHWPNERKYIEGDIHWKTCVARVNDGPLKTAPVKGQFCDELIRGQYY